MDTGAGTSDSACAPPDGASRSDASTVSVRRGGRVEPFLHAHPRLSSAAAQWSGVAFEEHEVPACAIPRHEHAEDFLHVVLEGSVRYEVLTRGKTFKLRAKPGTIFVLPRGTIDEIRWSGPTRRIAVSLHPRLLLDALEETAHRREIELAECWDLSDPNIMALLVAMRTDLDAGSPAGRLYGESLSNALAVYLLKRYALNPRVPTLCRGGLPGHRLRRVIDYMDENLSRDLTLAQLAAVAGMSPHYFAELFRQSTGRAPHQYVLQRRIDFAKRRLSDPRRSVIEAALDAGFQNPSHFARVFRKWVGISPSDFRSAILDRPFAPARPLET
ncbi:MAG: helix-turn-helix transcriptional regulator [Gammaproteobacteria bacterium]|nr:helix-turn-helix transcriptional regulator [Gammaproteobacteria bacterium]